MCVIFEKFVVNYYLCTENKKLNQMRKTLLSIAMMLSLGITNVKAQNPYMPLWEFIPDGEPYVFEDPDNPGKYRVYVYGSHDNLVTEYCGRDQVVWSASVDDLTHWRYDGIIFVNKSNGKGEPNKSGKADVLYAPDMALVKDAAGKKTYYLYPNNQEGGRNGMVARSSRPDGKFEVINWNKDNADVNDGILGFDPAVFVDDDGRVYGYWGFKRCNGAELDPETMATVKSGTKIVEDMIPGYEQDTIYRFFEASSMRKIKDKYVYIYSRWTKDGDFGLGESNYTLAYCYGNSPLGPFKYGGTIIDGRGRKTKADGTTIATACPNGNTHGSICEINGQWYVFYHRQAGTTEYSRQAMVAPIDVEVNEGPNGYVKISEGELTSEGFAINGLNPFKRYSAGIACYYTGPEPAHAEYPNVVYSGSHTEIYRMDYDGKKNPYDSSINRCAMVNNVSGSTIGYKYFNFDKMKDQKFVKMVMNIIPEGVDGTIDIMLDQPTKAEGGKSIGSLKVKSNMSAEPVDVSARVNVKNVRGKHAIYLIFTSKIKGKSICKLNEIGFESGMTL